MTVYESLNAGVRIVAAALLIYAAAQKLAAPRSFRLTLTALRIPRAVLVSAGVPVVELAGREAHSVELMAARGLLADPTHRNREKCVWEEEAALGWFRSLHEHAVIVPANDLVLGELAAYGAYLCPLSSSHVGLARPRLLVMYRPGGQGLVFDVTAVEVVHQQAPGTRRTNAVDSEDRARRRDA
ncbi:MauE/DoxX family redox-associated membrane protein [Streptomyces spiramyceticus]|uniref:MauE/DoxX family redox-associated membrane protein n=1 Tax=Streptomyces spiramyceticus TaxID=299717 RepID=UPI00237AB4C2|nr:MauE/DoxX family redox-associated membrane protein [Streptomyces spiramyceticus]